MKIGMLTDTFLPIHGGGEVHVLELSRALRRQGHAVTVATATPGETQVDGFPVLREPRLNLGGRRALARLPLALPRLLRWARTVDMIHAHYSYLMAMAGVWLARFTRRPLVVTLHGLGTLDSSVARDPLVRSLYRAVSLRGADKVIATSEEMRAVALRFVPDERIAVIPNGVDTRTFAPQPAPPREEIVVLSMRRLAPKNGVQYLVEAIPFVRKALPQARFWITGEGKLEAHLRRRVDELGVGDVVTFLGVVPHAQTRDRYAQADVVVFPSSAESTSLACLEAMAMEKAIVASALAAYRQMLGKDERGLLVPLFDRVSSDYDAPLTLPEDRIRALAAAIVRLGRDAGLRAELGRRARQHVVAHYDWDVIARRTVAVYQSLV